jgi:hypothetical protein
VTPATPWGTPLGMILTEYGLHFAKDGTAWRCVEQPGLVMLRGGGYEVDGQGFATLSQAPAVRHIAEFVR